MVHTQCTRSSILPQKIEKRKYHYYKGATHVESSCCRNLSCFCRKRKDASSCIPTEKIPYTVEKCIKMLICCQKVLLDGGLLYFFWKTGLMQNPLEKALILRLHRLSWQRLRGVQCVGGILIKILLSTTWRPVMEGKEGKNEYIRVTLSQQVLCRRPENSSSPMMA